jgi:hypothetical protein
MGRNLKYKEQTVLFAKKVPISKLEAIKKLVSDYLVNDIEVVGVEPAELTFQFRNQKGITIHPDKDGSFLIDKEKAISIKLPIKK